MESQPPDVLIVLSSAWHSGLIPPESWPEIATQLLTLGFDSPALRELAGLDLAPYDHRDARDLTDLALSELAVVEPEPTKRLEISSALLAYQLLTGAHSARQTTWEFCLLALWEDYPSEPRELLEMFQLDDAWAWRPAKRMSTEVVEVATHLMDRLGLSGWQPPQLVLAAMRLRS